MTRLIEHDRKMDWGKNRSILGNTHTHTFQSFRLLLFQRRINLGAHVMYCEITSHHPHRPEALPTKSPVPRLHSQRLPS